MRSPAEVRDLVQQQARGEFVKMLKCLMISGKNGAMGALEVAKQTRASDRVVEALKAATAAGSTTADDWSALVAFQPLAESFVGSPADGSLLDTILDGAMNVPLMQPIVVVGSGGAVGSKIGEGEAQPVFKLSLDTEAGVPEVTVVAMVAVTLDLLTVAGARGDRLLATELQKALRRVQDTAALAALAPAASPPEIPIIAATGTTPTAAWTDIRKLIDALALDTGSRVVLGMSPKRAMRISLWHSTDGVRGFPGMTPWGGDIAGIPVAVSTRIADNQVYAFDSSGIAGSSGVILPDLSNQATIQLDTTPAEPTAASTVMISLWQRNMRAIRLQRRFGLKRVRDGSVAMLSNVLWNNPT
jgi:hypothetical protein